MDIRSIAQALRRDWVLPVAMNHLARTVAVCGTGLLLVVSLILVGRRMAGAFLLPLSPVALLLVGAACALVAWLLRSAWHHRDEQEIVPDSTTFWLSQFVDWGPGLALFLLALALTIPATGLPFLILFWTMIIASELVTLRQVGILDHQFRFHPRSSPNSPGSMPVQEPLCAVHSAVGGTDLGLDADLGQGADLGSDAEQEDSSLQLSQQLTRATDQEGCDLLFGTVWAELASGTRDANIHIAFCPPFSGSPSVEVEQADGPDARLKVAHIIPTGVRLEVRLAVAEKGPTRVAIELSVRSPVDVD